MKVDYTYNIRSWTKSIRSPLFAQTLYYNDKRIDNSTNIASYTGNVSAMDWTTTDNKLRGYDFAYDNLSRLTAADYLEGNLRSDKFSTSYSYDKQGNMLFLTRRGNQGTTSYGMIDNLELTYRGNQLLKVEGRATSPNLAMSMDFKNGSNQAVEYFYDANGNLTRDLNKKIQNIQYNYLNLPRRITFSVTNNAVTEYVYSAGGTKLSVIHKSSMDNRMDYVGNMIYENGSLKRILVDGGYIEGGQYYFYLQDHLGNNRVVAKSDGTVVQTTHYYPYGMSFAEGTFADKQPYKYNGKELDRKNGLDWYDYGARMYDAALGRWHAVDPMSEKYYSWSPYNYCKNNPVLRIDLDGKDDYVISRSGRLFNETPIDKRGKGSTDNLYLSSDRSISVTVNQGLLGEMHSMQAKERKLKSYGSTQDLEAAATVFKFAADHTTVEWKLDVYDDNGTRTAVVATDRDPYGVDNGAYAQNKLSVKGEKVIDIHSHLPGGTKGGAGNDFNLAKPQRKNAVYMKDNGVSTDKRGMIYEYTKNASRVNSIRVYDETDLFQYIKRK